MVAHATDGRLAAGTRGQVFEHVSTDSRAIRPETLFIALRGDRFDGHDFLTQAVAGGATGVIVDTTPAVPTGDAAVIVVRDTLVALQDLARAVRRVAGTRVVAVTGSAGKTTTKEITADLLATRYRVFRNRGNLNNHIGLPLSLLELRDRPDIAVVELGMNHDGEIRTLIDIAEPDVRVWTNVGDAHIGHFGSREAIARAKAEVLEGATADTLVVANADDPLVMEHVRRSPAFVMTFGEREGATVHATAIADRGIDGTTARIDSPSGEFTLNVPLPGRAQLSNVLAATTVALALNVMPDAVVSTVARLQPVARRGRVSMLSSGVRLVDDSYNASPAAVQAMLAAMAATPGALRRVAVLGEMRELGDGALALHVACGRAAAAAGVDELVAIGGSAARGFVEGARAGGMSPDHVHLFETSAIAAPVVATLVRAGDLVLVKGSRGTRTDLVSDQLMGVA